MARFSGSVSARPVRAAFLVPPEDLTLVARAAQLSCCVWGGRYNPIVPFFETGGDRWKQPFDVADSLDVARGYVNFFEPDTLVEAVPGMAEKLGWRGNRGTFGLPRVIALEDFYKVDNRGRTQFAAGIDIIEPIHDLYDAEFKFERRHKQLFADVEQSQGNAFFDVFLGRYPPDESLSYIPEGYREAFSAEKLAATAETAMKFLTEGYVGPLWVTDHGLTHSVGRGAHSATFCVFDPTDPGDVIDVWNYRLIHQDVAPISLQWFADQKEFVRERISTIHRPIPDNPFGTHFHSVVQFGNSISNDELIDLSRTHLADLPDRSFFAARPPLLWRTVGGPNQRETKILATVGQVSFDEVFSSSERYLKLPAPAPSFLNVTQRFARARWVNLIVVSDLYRGQPDLATVYPSNIWSPDYPRLGNSGELRVAREGWVLPMEHNIGYSLLELQQGRAAIVGWLDTHGIKATPSEEGQVASRVIATAETLLACGMFADLKTLQLLNGMAESHTEVSRNGKPTMRSTPDRAKQFHAVSNHFKDRANRSFGFWCNLDHFLERSVFRAGLRVQCPVCAYFNWYAMDALSYKPTCSRCLNQFDFAQAPDDLRRLDWYYRITGPFAAPDYARGAYAVALTLRTLAPHHYSEITWSTGLRLDPLNCEIDFVAWHRSTMMGGLEERDEPLLVLGEAKSFGVGSINEDAIGSLKAVAERFPGAIMVVSTLREIRDYSLAEIARLRHLAFWGRRKVHQDQPINPLIVLTGTELFARWNVSDAWKEADGVSIHAGSDVSDLHMLGDLTLRRYLGLGPRYYAADRLPNAMETLLSLIKTRATSQN